MNYRHAFHAGNFADLAKHAAIGLVLDRLLADPAPLLAIDTHAGAGVYDLAGEMARKSGEAEAGVARLMADPAAPPAFDGLKAAVRRLNSGGPIRFYPGSPVLVAGRLRPGDAYVGAELREDDFVDLRRTLRPFGAGARAARTDGYDLAAALTLDDRRRALLVVDPPFERADDYGRVINLAGNLLQRKSQTAMIVWTPLKDLETFDAFIGGLEGVVKTTILVAEVRLKPLNNPLSMNGCGLIFINLQNDLAQSVEPAFNWIARNLGAEDARANIWSARP